MRSQGFWGAVGVFVGVREGEESPRDDTKGGMSRKSIRLFCENANASKMLLCVAVRREIVHALAMGLHTSPWIRHCASNSNAGDKTIH